MFNWNSSLRSICPFTPNYFLFNLFLPVWICCTLWFTTENSQIASAPAIGAPSSRRLRPSGCPILLGPSLYFLVPQCTPGSSGGLPALILKSSSSLSSFGFFHWRRVFRNQDPHAVYTQCFCALSACGLSQQAEGGNGCVHAGP